MITLSQSPVDPGFVQNPYPFYREGRSGGDLGFWQDYQMPAAFSHRAVATLLKDKRFGREVPSEFVQPVPEHLKPFYDVEAHSLLEMEPPRHTRLRKLVLHAFTSRRVSALSPAIASLCDGLIDRFPAGPFDLLATYCTQVPVLTIARLLGVPTEMAPQFLSWSHDMVAMYQAGRSRRTEEAAANAARKFAQYMSDYIQYRRSHPADDLMTELIAAEEQGDRLSTDELITTCILLLNAGHEATVHTLGNGIKILLERETDQKFLSPDFIGATVEEILRFDPPLHMFTRYAYEDLTVFGHQFKRGDQVALLLGSANRDSKFWHEPDRFAPTRQLKTNASFGGGIHFCVGAPLARLEMQIALITLFDRCPGIALAEPPVFANTYHFHGLSRLLVST